MDAELQSNEDYVEWFEAIEQTMGELNGLSPDQIDYDYSNDYYLGEDPKDVAKKALEAGGYQNY
jgi:hypothetical protein